MLKIGFAINSLAPSQLSYYLVREINRFLSESKNANTDIVLFQQEVHTPRQMPLCAVMHINEMWGFDGVLIPTSVATALKSIRVPGPKFKLFYPYTLEWIRPQPTAYASFAPAYTAQGLQIVARNQDHADIIGNCFNRKVVGLVEDFRLSELMEIIKSAHID